MISLHTNLASMRIQGALGNTQQNLTTSMTRLGTGYRINSAADDAAGLQIATRLLSQSRGMTVASQNTENAKSMLQTAEGAFGEIESILHRMKDLTTQAADSGYAQADRDALQKEFDALGTELVNIMGNTSYGGEKLMATSGASGAAAGKLTEVNNFQIGNTSGEVMKFDVSNALKAVDTALKAASQVYKGTSGASGASGASSAATDISTVKGANALLDQLTAALDAVGNIRGEIGAGQNRLTHIGANLSNMTNNTKDAEGRIRDVDYAAETANMTKLNILQQAGGSMLKQSAQMSQLVLSLLQ